MRYGPTRAGKLAAASLALLALLGTTARAADWPQWRGPNRDGKSTETGLLKQWPDGGPKLLWQAKGLGDGFATITIAKGLLYTAGNLGGNTVITALDLGGKTQWTAKNGSAWTKSSPGSRSVPTIDGDRLYHRSPLGNLVCLDAKTGKQHWGMNTLKKFGGRNITWALAASLLVDGGNLIVCPGARTAMAALNKATGETVWTCEGKGERPSYASPIAFEHEGIRQIVTMTAKAAIGVEAKAGRLLWLHRHTTSYDCNIPDPIFHDGHVFICSGYGSGAELLKLNVDGDNVSVSQVWRSKKLDNHHGGVLLVDGHLYGSTHRGAWVCLDFKTGDLKYSERGVGKGSVLYADGMLYCYSEGGGNVGLVPATPDAHRVVSRFRVPRGGRGPSWPHPVICDGRLYLRHGDLLFCYDIKP